ncbi:hypothetical protein AB0942_00505 [Streptomyces nodosus]|uniref:MBL fold metallo-hydrolase n=1 Tax=Streptomyces nodosus TaxID=40318 RepID=UPI0034514F36
MPIWSTAAVYTPNGSVVFSGDTSLSDNIVRLARGADILVHEVIELDTYKNFGLPAALLDHLKVSHTDVKDIGPLAQRCGGEHAGVQSYRARGQEAGVGRLMAQACAEGFQRPGGRGRRTRGIPLRGSRS